LPPGNRHPNPKKRIGLQARRNEKLIQKTPDAELVNEEGDRRRSQYNHITEYVENRADIGDEKYKKADSFCDGKRELNYVWKT
jgi:hypothetical protein